MQMTFSEQVRSARQAKRWSKSDLAKHARVPLDVINAAERNEAVADEEKKLICDVLAISYDFVVLGPAAKIDSYPYRGLSAFQESDTPLFFGRERFTERILKKLERGAIVGVIGASGSGKSSIVRAGVIPMLKARHSIRLCALRPQRRPMAGLTAAIADLILDDRDRMSSLPQLQASLSSDPALIVQELHRRCAGHLLLIFIDQFEELFAQTDSELERNAFLNFVVEIAGAASIQSWQCRIIFSIRGDFYQQMMANSEFSELCQDQLVPLTQMNADELRDAIVKPAESASRRVDEDLVNAIIGDAGKEPGNMPLVSFCLSELWTNCVGISLTLEAYHRMGGLNGAIASQAENVFQGLNEPQQQAARRLMSRLVHIEEDTRAGVGETRRKLRYDSVASNEQEKKVVEQLIASRLVITDYDVQENAQTIEYAHEAVIKHWKRLGGWLLEDRAFLVWQQRVEANATLWLHEGRPKSAVLRGSLLSDGRLWMTTDRVRDVKALVREYVEESLAVFEEEARTRYEGLLRTLLGAEPENISSLIAEMRASFANIQMGVVDGFLDENRNDRGVWKIRLLRLRDDATQGEHILEHLKGCDPSELPPIILALKDISDIVADPLKALLVNDQATLPASLRAACVYANLEPRDDIWHKIARRIAEGLIGENPLHLLVFTQCLMPVADHLFDSIRVIMSDDSQQNAVRDNAALILLEFAENSSDKIVEILINCTDQVLEFVFGAAKVKADHDGIAARLREIVRVPSDPLSSERLLLENGRRRASAAIVLAKMGSLRDSLPVLSDQATPDSASQFVFRAKRLGVDCGALAQELVRAETAERIYWLSLAVGEYAWEDIAPVTRNALLKETVKRFREHPSAAVHSVSAWLLDALKQHSVLESASQELSTLGRSKERDWFHVRGPCGPIAFVEVPAGEFRMGALEDEAGFKPYEGPAHLRIIEKPFAACVREVTVGEYAAFVSETGAAPLQNIAEFSPDQMHPAIALTWSEAGLFCEWLTDYVNKGGTSAHLRFTLPTEVEWEYCARAGTLSAYSFGSDIGLLEKFAWYEANSNFKAHPAGILRPNQFGLFNIHGNCWEWCEDIYTLYDGTKAQPFDARAVSTREPLRTLRGGCWNLHWRYSRSACRNWHAPTNRNYYTGMRLFCDAHEGS